MPYEITSPDFPVPFTRNSQNRKYDNFRSGGVTGNGYVVTLDFAMEQIDKVAYYLRFSAAVEIVASSWADKSDDPAVCVCFVMDEKRYAIPMDRFSRKTDNIFAVYLFLDGLRSVCARSSISSVEDMLKGFEIPQPSMFPRDPAIIEKDLGLLCATRVAEAIQSVVQICDGDNQVFATCHMGFYSALNVATHHMYAAAGEPTDNRPDIDIDLGMAWMRGLSSSRTPALESGEVSNG